MAGLGRGWTKSLAVAVLLLGAGAMSFAQSAQNDLSTSSDSTGSLTGKLTDLYSKPLDGVTVVLRNQASGAEARTITAKNGAYLFTELEPGEYTLTAESPQLGRGHLEEIVVDAGHEARVQTAMAFEPLPPGPVLAASRPVNRPKIEPPTLPVSDAALAAEPLQTMAVSARRLSAEIPETAAPEVYLPLASETLETLAVAGRSLPDSAPPATTLSAPAASTLARTAANGSQVSEARPGVPVVNGNPAPALSGSMQTTPSPIATAATPSAAPVKTPAAAIQPAQPPPQPVLTASQEASALSSATTSTMSAAALQALPLSGRRWQDFVLDNIPTSATPAGGQGQISLRGTGQQSAEIAVDGVGKGLAFGAINGSGQSSSGRGPLGQGGDLAGMAQVGAGGHGLAMAEAAIRAVETAAGNVEAAAGRAAGGRMNVETLSGANQLYGQGFFFDRQNTWGAKNPFTQWVKETTPPTPTAVPVFTLEPYTPPDHETTWGIGVGSRIRRDKLFWFAAVDGYHRNYPGISTVKHPYLCATSNASDPCSEETGFFAQPSNDQMQVLSARLGLGTANPIAEGLAAYSNLLETLARLLGPAPRTATQWTGFARLDGQAAERHRFTLEGTGAHWNSPGGGLTRVSEIYGNRSLGSTQASEVWLLGRWEAFLTPNLLAVTQGSAGRAIQEARPETPSAFEQSFLAGNVWGQLPQIVVDNRYGYTIGNPSRFGAGSYPDEHLYRGKESVDWIRGKLLIRVGFEVSRNADATTLLRNQTGTYTYSSVENFASDALAFGKFSLTGTLDPNNQHNCDQTGKVWRDSSGNLRGLGNLPCYSYYSQTMGPAGWRLSTIDWVGYATAQWQANKQVVVSAGLRWEREQLPPPLAMLSNPGPLLTQKLPALGSNWGPRLAIAVGTGENHWPVLRLGYGMYFGRTENVTVETAMTQTGSLAGDLNFFMRPTDNLNSGGAPPFPYVLAGEPSSAVKPGTVEFAPSFHNPEVHQAIAAVEETLPGHVEVTASAMVSLGRRLPISIDTNLATPPPLQTITYNVCDQTAPGHGNGSCGSTGLGPIKATQITVPFYASWPSAASPTGFAGRLNPDYQQITQIMSRANSTYEAAMLKVDRYGHRGLSLHAHYTYAHAMDWNPNESAQAAGSDVLDPADFNLEYGTSNLDIRHSASVWAIYEAPWKLHGAAGKLGNGWMLSGIWRFRGGMPYTMHTSGSLPKEFTSGGAAIVGLGPGMNGSGGDNRVYGLGNDGHTYNIGRNTYRYPSTWKADQRLGKRFELPHARELELLIESFNLFNHQNVTELETTGYFIESGTAGSPPTLNFLTGLKTNTTAFGEPLNINATNFFRERQIQLGLRMRF